MGKLFKDLIGKNVVILGHHNADPDSIGSAEGMKELVAILYPDSVVSSVMPDDISELSRNIIDTLELDVQEKYEGDVDTLIVVDAGGLNQVGDWASKIANRTFSLIVIDHHTRNPEFEDADVYILEEASGSTSEIVHRLFQESNLVPSSKVAEALLAGIAFDTKLFTIGQNQTYESVSDLLEITGDISSTRALFFSKNPLPERIARIKAAQRCELHQLDEWLIALSRLGSFQSSGARALISLGADLSVVSGESKGEVRSSLRSTLDFYNGTKIHLGDMVSTVSKYLNGEGSGHPTAAGYNGEGEIDELHSAILDHLKSRI